MLIQPKVTLTSTIPELALQNTSIKELKMGLVNKSQDIG